MSIGLSIFFIKGKKAPRWVIVTAVVAATIGIPATSDNRQLAQEDPLQALQEIDFAAQFQESLELEARSELKNATAVIAATQWSGDYQLGAGYWNELVFRFVPAQFLGREFKDSLMIGGERRDMSDFVEDQLGAGLPVGLTVTGIGDSFNEFGYFGCLFFAALAYLFKTLWAAANRATGTVAQILYIQLTTSAMRAATHQTATFIPSLIYSLIFIGAIAFFARERRPGSMFVPEPRAAEVLSK